MDATIVPHLPQELIDEILFWRIKSSLPLGKIFLDEHGKPYGEDTERDDLDKRATKVDFSILRLSKKMLPRLKNLLYKDKIWVMPSNEPQEDFFNNWDQRDLRSLPAVELRPTIHDVWGFYHHPDSAVNASTGFIAFRLTGYSESQMVYPSISDNDYSAQTFSRLRLMAVWCDTVFPRDCLSVDKPVYDFDDHKHCGVGNAEPLLDVHDYPKAPRRTLLGVPVCDCPDQVIALSEESRRGIEFFVRGKNYLKPWGRNSAGRICWYQW